MAGVNVEAEQITWLISGLQLKVGLCLRQQTDIGHNMVTITKEIFQMIDSFQLHEDCLRTSSLSTESN